VVDGPGMARLFSWSLGHQSKSIAMAKKAGQAWPASRACFREYFGVTRITRSPLRWALDTLHR
jgi:hypothetical protein